MAQITIWMTTARHIADKGALGPILIQLMLASNDITLANDGWQLWHGDHGNQHKDRITGARMYFLRLLIAHLHEGMKIIREIRKTPELMRAVDQCDEKTRADFETIWSFVGTEGYKSVITLRNKIGSHWERTVVAPTLQEMKLERPEESMTLAMSTDMLNWYFEPADRIIDQIVVRKAFSIPSGSDVDVEVDRIVRSLLDAMDVFVDFAGHFVRFHTRKG